jgi:enoyl-CoA hydratase/carnithine racemase
MLIREQRGPVSLLTVDRPEAKNAISGDLAARLHDAFVEADSDEAVSVVVLASSSPDVLFAGGDLAELSRLPMDAGGADRVMAVGERLAVVERCRVPVVAAVAGKVLGGGCELLLMCDVVVMERSARLCFVHARMGLVPAWGGATRLAERIGEGAAADLLLTGREIDGGEAERLGLAQRVVADGSALEAALSLAEHMAAVGRAPLMHMKSTLLATRLARRGDAFAAERNVFRRAWGSVEHQRAFAAFRERKK